MANQTSSSICVRSLGETIIAAGSTLAVFGASNWGLACIVGDIQHPSLWMRIFYHSVIAFAMPVVPLYISIWNFFKVRAVNKRLHDHEFIAGASSSPNPRSIPIVTLCPLYIRIPALSYSDEVGARYQRVTDSQIKNLNPLQLAPAASSSCAAGAVAASQCLNCNAGMTAFSVDVEPNINDNWIYLQLPETCKLGTTEDVNDRFALLASGLEPEHDDIRYLRRRGPFQTTVTVVQASGYVLSVIERKWQQHLGVSPMEALISFLSVLVILQLLIELYACGNFERRLLLCLNHDQFTSFQNARPTEGKGLGSYVTRKHRIILFGCTFAIGALVGGAAWSYYGTYQPHYRLSSISGLVFAASMEVFFIYSATSLFKENPRNNKLPYLIIVNAIFVASMIFTLVSTIIDWIAFHVESTHNEFAWIFPHLSR